MAVPTAHSIAEELRSLPQLAELATWVHVVARAAFEARAQVTVVEPVPDGTTTAWGDVREWIAEPTEDPTARAVLGALYALAASTEPEPSAGEIAWLSLHTPIDALGGLDAAGERSDDLWNAVGPIATSPSDHGLGRGDALLVASALGASSSAAAAAQLARATARNPWLERVARRAPRGVGGGAPGPLSGELTRAPRGPLVTVLIAATGWLLVSRVCGAIGRVALGLRHPATLRVSEEGVEVASRTELLGKVLRERRVVVPFANLDRVTREVRFARSTLYAGLVCLGLGSYFGIGLVVDGARVPGTSPSLVALGLLVLALGLGADYALSSLPDDARGRCRVVVRPRKGAALAVGNLDPAQADALLDAVARSA